VRDAPADRGDIAELPHLGVRGAARRPHSRAALACVVAPPAVDIAAAVDEAGVVAPRAKRTRGLLEGRDQLGALARPTDSRRRNGPALAMAMIPAAHHPE